MSFRARKSQNFIRQSLLFVGAIGGFIIAAHTFVTTSVSRPDDQKILLAAWTVAIICTLIGTRDPRNIVQAAGKSVLYVIGLIGGFVGFFLLIPWLVSVCVILGASGSHDPHFFFAFFSYPCFLALPAFIALSIHNE